MTENELYKVEQIVSFELLIFDTWAMQVQVNTFYWFKDKLTGHGKWASEQWHISWKGQEKVGMDIA